MIKPRNPALAILVVTLMLAPGQLAAQATDLARARAELLAADARFGAEAAGTAFIEALPRMLAANATVLAPGMGPVHGAREYLEILGKDSVAAASHMTWWPVRADVSADGVDGYMYGYAVLTWPSGEKRPGKYLAYWRREPGQPWRVIGYKRVPRPDGDPAPVPAAFAAATAASGKPAAGGRARAMAEISATDSAFAREAQQGASQAFLKYVATDGATMGSKPGIAYGPKLAAEEFTSFAPGEIDWNPAYVEAAQSGDLGFAVGPVKVLRKDANGASAMRVAGYYLTIWQRQADGTWRLIIDG